jgi:hypothetical protein
MTERLVRTGPAGAERAGTEPAAAEVTATYQRYLRAFIDSDLPGIDAVVSYPLAYVGVADVQMHDTFPINPAELRRAKAWHTTLDSRFEVVAATADKAHVVLFHADRVRADGSLIETISAFYAFRRTADGWKLYAISDVVNPAESPPA